MTVYPFCDPYVWENPKVLLSTGLVGKYHKEGQCASEYVNIIILVLSIAFIVGSIGSVVLGTTLPVILSTGIATVLCISPIWTLIQLQTMKESFTDAVPIPTGPSEVYDVIGMGAAPAKLTLPTAKNPFMNVLLDEIKYNPTRPMAASVTDLNMKVSLDDFFRTEFTSDPTDVFGKTQSQRQFITMPSTGIPNDQGSYQDWLYKIPGKTCKEGGREACLPGTDGAAIPWLNVTPA